MSGQVYKVPFAQIPEWILDAEISDRAVRLFCVLDRHADTTGRAFPGRSAIAERLRCSTGSVDRALNELRNAGAVISIQKKHGPAIVGNDYWLWPATPYSQVSTPSPTAEATPSPTGDATVDSPVTRQEEREPVNESQKEREPVNTLVVVDDDVQVILAAYQAATGKRSVARTPDREKKIKAALKHYPVADLVDAVRGWRWSPHHCGHNERGTVYNDIELLLRDAKHIEQFRDWERDMNRPRASATHRNGAAPRLSKSFQNVDAVFDRLEAQGDRSNRGLNPG